MRFRFEISELLCRMLLAFGLVALPCTLVKAQCYPEQIAKLLADDGAENDRFGALVGISGTTAIVSATSDDDNGDNSGAAFLFDTNTGQQIAKLLPNDGTEGDKFGVCNINGTTAIVSAIYDDDNGVDSGSAYLFDTTTAQQIHKLLPNDGAAEDQFGRSVGISGSIAIVGAHRDDDNGVDSGSAYLFDTTTGQQLAKLIANDGAAGDWFGRSVAISGTTAIVGAHRDDDNGVDSGSAYLFDTTTGQQLAKLIANDGAAGDWFGRSVAISGTTAIVGAQWDDDNGIRSGSAFLFDTTTGQQIAKILPDDGAGEELFGWSVAISGTIAVVGAAPAEGNGSAYLFDINISQQIAKLLASDGAYNDKFGGSVSLDGSTALVGASLDDDNGDNSGSAYLFVISCSEVVVPDSFLVTRGSHVAGDATSLAASDNLELALQRLGTDVQSRTEFEVVGTSPTSSPTSFEVTLEGSVFARSTVVQTIELWDYVAGAWELVDTRNATNMFDSIATVVPTGDLSRFVDQTTLEVKARVHFQSLSARQRFASNTDQFVWSIGQ